MTEELEASNYTLTRSALGQHPRIPITRAEYEDIQRATDFVHAVTDIERPFDLVIRSYIEFEKSLSNSAINHMIRLIDDRIVFLHEMQEHLMRLATLLTTCRMYLDQTDKSLKSAPLNTLELATPFSQAKSRQYDESFSYRLLEALRNFVQHQGQGIHQLTHRAGWVGENEERRILFSTDVFVDPTALHRADINAKFRTELTAYQDRLDLRVHARHYVERLGSIQADIRSWLGRSLSDAKAKILTKIEIFEALDPNRDSIGLVAAEKRSDGTLHSEIHLMRNSLRYLDALQTTNGTLVNLSKRYATSEPQINKKP